MKNNARSSWMITMPVAALAAGYVYLFFLPGQRAIHATQLELAARKAMIAEAGALTPAIDAAARELASTRKVTAAWKDAAPPEGQLNELFGGITGLAKVAGTVPTRFEPQASIQEETLQRVPVVLGCAGQFSQVMQFLHDLEALPQTVWINKSRVETGEDGENVKCELVLEIFADNSNKSGQAEPAGGPIKETDSSH